MTIVARAAGTRGTTAPGVSPGTAANDIVCLFCAGNALTAGTSPAATGFALLGTAYQNSPGGSSGRYVSVLIKKATGADAGTYAVTGPSGGTLLASEAVAFSGCDVSGPLFTLLDKEGVAGSSTATAPVSGSAAADDFIIEAISTDGSARTLSSIYAGWAELGLTTTSVLHEVGRVSPGETLTNASMTMSGVSSNRPAILFSLPVLGAAPAAEDGGLLGLLAG